MARGSRLRNSEGTVHYALQPNMRLKLSARGRRLCRKAQWRPSFLSAAPAGRSLSANPLGGGRA